MQIKETIPFGGKENFYLCTHIVDFDCDFLRPKIN